MDDEFTVGEATLLSAFDYAIGRKTYVVSEVVRDLQDNCELMTTKGREYMIRKIEQCNRDGQLGHNIDKQQWLRLLQHLREAEELA